MGCCCSSLGDIYIAKEDVTLWSFKGDVEQTTIYPKGTEFYVLKKEKGNEYETSDRYWEFQKKGRCACKARGFASRFYFYPKNFDSPEEMNPWYFGILDRQETKEILNNEANGDGAFFVRYSENKKKFVMSMKYFDTDLNDWEFKNYTVNRGDGKNNKGQFFFEQSKLFHNLEQLLEYYKEENQKKLPTNLTHTCFIPNPNADKNFVREQQIKNSKDSWIIPREEILIESELGRGNFGVVSKGKWRSDTMVAIKELKALDKKDRDAQGDKYEKEKDSFVKEMEIMKKLNHPNLVKMYGICIDKLPLYLIQELCEMGDLKNHLEKFKVGRNKLIKKRHQSQNPPNLDDLLEWCLQIAVGMGYLESRNIIHRDLAARNILLTKHARAKIADFGLARNPDSEEDETTFPVLWSSPEVLQKREFSSKSDVWSYGITVWEIFSYGDKPYDGKKKSELKRFLKENNRMKMPFDYTGDTEGKLRNVYEKVMRACWENRPAERPTFGALKDILTNDMSANYYSIV